MKREIDLLKQRKEESQPTAGKDILSLKSTETVKSLVQQSARDARSKATSEAGEKIEKKRPEGNTKEVRDLKRKVDAREQRIKALEK